MDEEKEEAPRSVGVGWAKGVGPLGQALLARSLAHFVGLSEGLYQLFLE